ncbi:MAG: FecR domain-containing protein [Bacteroidota bacterium]
MSEFLEEATRVRVDDSMKAKSWADISKQIDKAHKSKTRSLWPVFGVAATFALIITSIAIFYTYQNTETVEALTVSGEIIVHELPDGSIVTLNAQSRINYNSVWDRKLFLDGEAFFEVNKGRKFTVSTPLGAVNVLGTSFNVHSRDSIFEIECKTGKVSVMANARPDKIELLPGQFAYFSNEKYNQGKKPNADIGNWTNGEFYFLDKEVSEVFAEVERQYNTKIEIKEGDSLKFSGYFLKQYSLEETLESICIPVGLTFEKGDDIYIIGIRK